MRTLRGSPMRPRPSIGLCIGVILASSLQACGNASTDASIDAPDEIVQQRLLGTWLREFEENGIRVRRLLVLESDATFRETSRVTDVQGGVTEHSHAGGWLYDGTNLKRKYTRMDGKQPAAPTLPFAAFELRFASNNEFIGIDNVHKREVRYRRVQPETQL
jgi:hypothetical protein